MYESRPRGYRSQDIRDAKLSTPSSITYPVDPVTFGDEIKIRGTLNPIVRNKITSNLRISRTSSATVKNEGAVACQTRTYILNGKMEMKKQRLLSSQAITVRLDEASMQKAAAVIRYLPEGEMMVDVFYNQKIRASELHKFAQDVVKHPRALIPPSSPKGKTRSRKTAAVH